MIFGSPKAQHLDRAQGRVFYAQLVSSPKSLTQRRDNRPSVLQPDNIHLTSGNGFSNIVRSSNQIIPEDTISLQLAERRNHRRCFVFLGTLLTIFVLGAAATAVALALMSATKPLSTISITLSTTTATTVTILSSTVTTLSTTSSSTSATTITTTNTVSTTSTTSITSTLTSTTTTSTTTFDACGILSWNLTGIRVAGTGVAGDTPEQLRQPRYLYIDANDVLYICDYNNNRIQKWILGDSNGTTVAGKSNGNVGSNSIALDHPTGLAFDKYGNMYVADYGNHRIQRFSPNSTNGTTVAGTGGAGVATTKLDSPTAVIVDDNLNMFITENGNNRLVFWPFNATNSTILINGRSGGAASGELSNPYDLILLNTSGNQVYLSDPAKDRVQLWMFEAAVANVTFATANALKLSTPRQIRMDPYGNLYVADSLRQRVAVFCANSSDGYVAVGRYTNSTPTFDDPSGIAFDSNLNLYVASSNNHEVLKYQRL